MSVSIGAVVVTYNRLDKLKKALASFDAQTVPPAYLVVVDNASGDGTREFLAVWEREPSPFQRHVLREEANVGGSGGFHDGMRHALELGADWLWLSDDDAYLEPDALERATAFLEAQGQRRDTLSAICSTILLENGVAFRHRRTIQAGAFSIREKDSTPEDYDKESFSLNTLTYVGAIINRKALDKVGLPLRDYFIWYDDTEHSLRLSEVGEVVCVPSIRVFHDLGEGYATGAKDASWCTWKLYYESRNKVDCYKRHFSAGAYRCWLAVWMLQAAMVSLKYRDSIIWKIRREGLRDANAGRFGIHPLYRPGWKHEVSRGTRR